MIPKHAKFISLKKSSTAVGCLQSYLACEGSRAACPCNRNLWKEDHISHMAQRSPTSGIVLYQLERENRTAIGLMVSGDYEEILNGRWFV